MKKTNKIIKARVDTIRGMHNYIVEMVYEDDYFSEIYEAWTYLVPDDANLDDFLDIAEDDEFWLAVCDVFVKLIHKM